MINSKELKSYIDEGDKLLETNKISFAFFPSVAEGWDGHKSFNFLNLKMVFESEIDWGCTKYGKLWNYNLQYCNYLIQDKIPLESKRQVVESLYGALMQGNLELEPYPVSLRVINLIRFLSEYNINNNKLLRLLFGELKFLSKRIEYHILGNHLLENGFALCLGGAFFKKEEWLNKGIHILSKELKAQILFDGAHFELSPMYHQIILFRMLELIDWYERYDYVDVEFLSFCKAIASKMSSWLRNITFENGDIPLFNDAAKEIALPSSFLLQYADLLNIKTVNLPLGDSGYRKFKGDDFEIKLDLAQIGASYQPGHAHADALSFIAYYRGHPLFVEQGTSTYQICERRALERSTRAHNTVTVNDEDQSQVWGGFRVGKRAKTTIHTETEHIFKASHDGYKRLGVIHTRDFILDNNEIQLIDRLSKNIEGEFHLHLHPQYMPSKIDKYNYRIGNFCTISFFGAIEVSLIDYEYAESYNQYTNAQKFIVLFSGKLITKILFEQ